ncbi:MAG TPA: polysaccharide deacetylase family protein [Myxococcaceae bacterium]|nr:polysaccharide deacetylase family protein [Myxococcaceae bacterium]
MNARLLLGAVLTLLVLGTAPGCKRPPAYTPSVSIEMAVTVDDLPRHGPDVPGVSRADVHRQLLDALVKHKVPAVYGFVNGSKLVGHPEDRASLEAWMAAGYPLGNHTYTHADAAKVPVEDFLADVVANESVLAGLMGPGKEQIWKVLRYPYLHQGQDLAGRAQIRRVLVGRSYRIAEVTVDFEDWAWNGPYARCLAAADEKGLQILTESYLDAAEAHLRWSDDTARRLFGRQMRHILLLHVGAFDARMADGLLTLYEKLGVKWIDLAQANQDAVYREEPSPPRTVRGPLLFQVVRSREWAGFPLPTDPEDLLGLVCR